MLAYLSALFIACLGVTMTLMGSTSNSPEANNPTNSYVLQGSAASGVNARFNNEEARAASLANNLMVYSNAVTAYVRTNSAYTGVVPGASITLPAWFVNAGWTNYVASGYIYVYSATPVNLNVGSISQQLAIASKGDLLAGEVKSGQFYNPGTGVNASITLPVAASIPNNSPLYITTVN